MARLWAIIANALEYQFGKLLLVAAMVGFAFGTGFLLGNLRHCEPRQGSQNCTMSELDQIDARAQVYAENHHQPPKLTFYDVLNAPVDSRPEPSVTPVAPEAPKEESQEGKPPPPLPDEKPSSDRMAEALSKVLGSDTPSSVRQTIQDAPKKVSFAVQVASLPSKTDAVKLQQQLSQKGYKTDISEGAIPGKGTYYRVRISGFASRDRAEAERLAFQQKEGHSAIVVME